MRVKGDYVNLAIVCRLVNVWQLNTEFKLESLAKLPQARVISFN